MCPPDHFEVAYVINQWMEGHSANTNDSLAYRQWNGLRTPQRDLPDIVFTSENRGSRSRPILLNRGPSPPWSILARQQDGLFMKWRVIFAVNDTGTAGVDREESCGETANVSTLKAGEPDEVSGIDENLPRLTEAGLAAELAPVGCGLGKVAGGDVVPDLVPFGRRQYPPQRLGRPHEAVEVCGPILLDPTRWFIEQEYPASTGGTADRLHQAQLVVGRQVMDR